MVESQSLQVAGARIGLSASALSRVISDLEAELGTPLFDRQTKRMVPNAAAQIFFVRAREAVLFWEDLTLFGRGIARDHARPLRVAALSRHAETVVAPVLARLLRERTITQPVTLDLHAQRDFAFSRLARPFDIGFGNLIGQHPELEHSTLALSPIVAVVPPDHPLKRENQVSAQQLAGYPLVQLQRDTIIGTIVRDQLRSTSDWQVVAEVSHTNLALRMVMNGAGIHVTDALAATVAEQAGCHVIPVAPAHAVPFLAFWPRSGGPASRAVLAIQDAVTAALSQHGDAASRPLNFTQPLPAAG